MNQSTADKFRIRELEEKVERLESAILGKYSVTYQTGSVRVTYGADSVEGVIALRKAIMEADKQC